MIPELSDERLCLRGFSWADFSAFAAMWQEPEVARHIPFAPIATDDNWVRFNLNIFGWLRNGYGTWAVADRDGDFLGTIGLFKGVAHYGPDYDDAIQAGWVFNTASHGKGHATRAARLAHDWLDAQPFGGRSVCGMDAGHVGSIRVAEKIGYRLLREFEEPDGKVRLMERTRSD